MDNQFLEWWNQHSQRHNTDQALTVHNVYAAWIAGRDAATTEALKTLAEQINRRVLDADEEVAARAAVRAALGGK